MLNLKEHPHRRYNPLTGEWVLVSPHRSSRPWQGQTETLPIEKTPSYDPSCYLCPGNERAGGKRNPQYSSTFAFDNDFSALLPGTPPESINEGNDLIIASGEPGICRVICFSPRHDLTLANMNEQETRAVIDVWVEQYQELGGRPSVNWVQIFENRGAMMGASNPHPHCQVWATLDFPNEAIKEQTAIAGYLRERRKCLLCEYLTLEERGGTRVVLENDHFVVVVPFWAIWPFETLMIAREHVGDIASLLGGQRKSLADILRRLTGTYDRIFQAPFPYSMGFHQKPTDGETHAEWHFHAHFYPPLLRSATVRKFMVGYELLATPQRDITPESAAERLRAVISGFQPSRIE
jgi:UDPglucose--hexose-1-phosphate uridylyltransferase